MFILGEETWKAFVLETERGPDSLSLASPVGNKCAWFLVWVVFHFIPTIQKLLHKHHKPICISSCFNNMGIITHACDVSFKQRSVRNGEPSKTVHRQQLCFPYWSEIRIMDSAQSLWCICHSGFDVVVCRTATDAKETSSGQSVRTET